MDVHERKPTKRGEGKQNQCIIIDGHKPVMGYPTIYFLKADNIVAMIHTGGVTKNKNAVKARWKRNWTN